MALTKQEFLVLRELAQASEVITRSSLDAITGLTSAEVDDAFDSLEAKGYVVDRRISYAGGEALEPYRVKSAVIQAAGMCSRFAPIAYDTPKGLVKVKGEVLIERMIRQLHAVGIYDVTLIVGHKKDLFAYLGPKYGVTFVENPEYALTNTCRSLYFALDRMSRSYVLYSDMYYLENPFERFVWEGYYVTRPLEGETDEWCFLTDDEGYVCDMVQGGTQGERTGYLAVLDEKILETLAPLMREAQNDWPSKMAPWETLWHKNIDTVKIRTKVMPSDIVFEFDSMDDLYAFDPDYLGNVVSQSLDNICGVLACTREQIHDCCPLTAGLTNMSCHFAIGDREYVYRHPMGLGGRFSDRADETKIEIEARRLGLDKTFIHEDPGIGWKVSRFIPNAHCCERENREQHRIMAKMLGEVHRIKGLTSAHTCSRWDIGMHFEQNMVDRGDVLPEWYVRGRNKGLKLVEYAKQDNFPMAFSHNDAWYSNFLIDEQGNYSLIDWEFAMMADEGDDFGYLAGTVFADREALIDLLTQYLTRKPTLRELRHYAAHTMHTAVYQAAWTLDFKFGAEIPTDWPIDLWLELMEKYLDEQLDWIIDLYENPPADLDAVAEA